MTIGFIGAVTDELPSLVNPAGIEDLEMRDPVEAANRVADKLRDRDRANGEADIIVLLVHEGAATTDIADATDDSRFGKIVNATVNTNTSNVDAIVSGHTHLAYNHVINGHPVISSGQYGERFSRMDIQYNKDADTFTMKNELFSLIEDSATPLYPDFFAVKKIVDDAVEVADELGSVELGKATADFGRAAAAGLVDGVPSFPENRGGESTLGNLVADVQLWALNSDQPRGRADRVHEPGWPACRPRRRVRSRTERRRTCNPSPTRS